MLNTTWVGCVILSGTTRLQTFNALLAFYVSVGPLLYDAEHQFAVKLVSLLHSQQHLSQFLVSLVLFPLCCVTYQLFA